MKILWYVLTVIFGAVGALAVLRIVELIFIGASVLQLPMQILIAVVMLALAFMCLRRARAAT